ncbi:G patch domain-containing protein 1 homolog isoform X1 [Manduca sexta]|uniref:G patch domain-containing protein 1 homolog isoform X1 n=1 Tax=Manduca sexta TaxID=7130 RepID=UPI00188EE913|nr:G patch domain-containing protein 1 homolog isoform X1 [Manduca sexta]
MSESDADEENFIRYGTPLEPFEEDEVPTKRKYQQQPDQYAVDEHGRRRFHGAFTGGFSAGFGNTVGSAEGWTPATFKSSRSEKAQRTNQRPEDFMDEEDRGEHGIAPRHMQTHSEFSGQKRTRPRQYHDGPIPGEPVLEQLVQAVHETAAVKMLRAMGWRQGQGTGERVSGQQKKRARDQHKVYGCYIPPEMRPVSSIACIIENTQTEDDNDSSSSEVDYDTLFAPDDYEPYILHRKNDRFGLGYSGLSRHSVLGNLVGEYGSQPSSSRSHLAMKEKGRKVSIRGQAFGVGAFEAEDDDIYASEDMSHYDFSLGGTDSKTDRKPVREKSNNVLEGFVKSSAPLPSVPSYPAPALPRDYRPAAAGARRSRFEPTDQPQRDQGLGRHELTAEARGALLGETPLTKQPEPSTKTIDKEEALLKVLGRNVNFVSKDTENKSIDFIPITDSGKELTKVFKPFASDRKKQARYERYLVDKAVVWERDGESDSLTEWEREREMVEFEQAAKLYKPLSGIMGDRFTHASEPDEALNPLSAVAKSSINYGLATREQTEAAARGVYGVMTRREAPWRPDSLVCKRFNVPEPGGVRQEEKKDDKPKVSYSIFSYMESSVHDKDSFTKEQSTFSGSKSQREPPKPSQAEPTSNTDEIATKTDETTSSKGIEKLFKPEITSTGFRKRLTVAELFLKESEMNKDQGKEVTETINKFDKMDLYKSIFLSDSEDEEPIPDKNKTDFIDVPKNVERNTSPPRGIFANINFDELNSWKRNDDKPPTGTKKDEEKIEEKDSNSNEEQYYGPKIPDNLKKRLEADVGGVVTAVQEIDSSSSSDSWVDVKEVKKKKKKKVKKHKSKHKKKNSKHKKKDR